MGMKQLAALFALLQFALLPAAVSAQDVAGSRVVSTASWIEEWDPVNERWVRVETDGDTISDAAPLTTVTTQIVNGTVVSETVEPAYKGHNASRYAVPVRSPIAAKAIAQYGPFQVLNSARAAVVGTTGPNSPAQFAAMLRDFPSLEVLELVDAGGTNHDLANLEVGRLIRAAGLTTHVPNNGSARSGGVELFLAGQERTMAPGAQFAVHSWLDNYGREPADFAPDAPENRLYLDYYMEMGMSEERARDFYAMTNSVPHSGALWLRADDMAPWIAPSRAPALIEKPVRMATRLLDQMPPAPIAALTGALPTPQMAYGPVARIAPSPIELATIEPSIHYADLSAITLAGTAEMGVAAL